MARQIRTGERALAVVGNAGSSSCWSGIPYHFWLAGKETGFLQTALDLSVPGLPWKRALWHLAKTLRGRRPRGFQYTVFFQRQMWSRFLRCVEKRGVNEVLSHYPLFPLPHLAARAALRQSYYIDTPLQALFEDHRMLDWLDPYVVRDALALEKACYDQAERVVGMAQWVKQYLTEHYKLSPAKVFTVLAAANLDEGAVERRLHGRDVWQTPSVFTRERPFRLGFTGKDWKRKGLSRLIDAASLLSRKGFAVEVVVIGHLPSKYLCHPLVRWAGFVDKRVEMDRFLDVLTTYDLGCSPSHQEPMGIAPLECLRMGIPVLCTAVGGLVDACPVAEGAGILALADAGGEDLAQLIEPLIREPERLQAMRDATWRIKERYSWTRAVANMKQIWGGAA